MQWILDNTGGAVATSAPTSNVDPFTGGGAYVPGSASSFPQPGSHNNDSIYANADPFTGGNLHTLAPYSSRDAHKLDCVLMRCRIFLGNNALVLQICKRLVAQLCPLSTA